MWVAYEKNTTDGETLEIILPSKVESIKKVSSSEEGIYASQVIEISYNGIDDVVRGCYIKDNIVESIRYLIKNLKYSIEWMDDPRKAPPAHPAIYKRKCQRALNALKERYLDAYPEAFI